MAERIHNYATIPTVLPVIPEGKLKHERVSGLPEKFTDPEAEKRLLAISNRLLLNINAIKEDLILLKIAGLLTVDDYKQFVVFGDSELITLNELLEGNVINRLVALETP